MEGTARKLLEADMTSTHSKRLPNPRLTVNNHRTYSLRILQQPVRARMCGFGDRDRRLLTPPIIVELLIHDTHTGQQIDAENIDTMFFILNTDLWSSDCSQELNIVMHPVFCSSEITSTRLTSARNVTLEAVHHSPPRPSEVLQTHDPPPPGNATASGSHVLYRGEPHVCSSPFSAHEKTYRAPGSADQLNFGGRTQAPTFADILHDYPSRGDLPKPDIERPPPTAYFYGSTSSSNPAAISEMSGSGAVNIGSEIAYTRNLIGAHTQSACKLKGLDGRTSIFFIFHDLSIRTEGRFCFRFSFFALETNGWRTDQPTDVLARTFSDPFQVYSAKKFPGMLAPTDLTKHFASQRVRIPTRTRKSKDEDNEVTEEDLLAEGDPE